MKIEWTEIDPESLPPAPEPCRVGIVDHDWRLTIDEGQIGLTSGCEQCDSDLMSPVGGEDVFMSVEIKGKVTSHLETYGWETPEYDHWWEFEPASIERIEDASTSDGDLDSEEQR